jgi:hypothetical protein
MAADGLDMWGVSADDRRRYLGIIEGRCVSGRNGAAWQVAALRQAHPGPPGPDGGRPAEAMRAMLREYRDRMHTNVPVHEWPWPAAVPAPRSPSEL